MHMTFRGDYSTSLEPLKEEHKILPATAVGKITIFEDIDGQIQEREMQNVLLVPGLERNLFSIGTINDKKFSFHCYEHECEIRDSDRKLTSRGVRHGKLFRMLFKVPVRCSVARLNANAENNMLKLWHERFGHLNIHALIKTNEVFADKKIRER